MPRTTVGQRAEKVRIGPISIITLIIVICMAVLAVLSVSTASATSSISTRQADATKELYLNESAAQEFVAGVSDALSGAGGKAAAGAKAVDGALDSICEAARAAADGQVDVVANVDGTTVTAEFTGSKMRRLSVAIAIGDKGTFRIEKWKAAAVQNESPTAGNLWMGA